MKSALYKCGILLLLFIMIIIVWWYLSSFINNSYKMEESFPLTCLNSDGFVFSKPNILMGNHNEYILQVYGGVLKFCQ